MSPATAPATGPATGPAAEPAAEPATGPTDGSSTELPAPPPRAGGWSVEQRGSFVVGRCDACDFTTSARRARYSVETDMLAHGPVCEGA